MASGKGEGCRKIIFPVVVVAVILVKGLFGNGPLPWAKARWDALQSKIEYNACKYKEAHALTVVAVRDDPTYATAYFRKGMAEAKLEEYVAAIESSNRCLELDGSWAEAYSELAHVYGMLDEHEKAIADCERAVALEPNDAGFHNSFGCALHKSGRHIDALVQVDRAVELKPDESIYWVNRGKTKNSLKRYGEALADFEQGLRLDPNSAYDYAGRAGCRLHMKQMTEAKADLDEALVRDGNCVSALRLRSQYSEGCKEYDLAYRDLLRVIQLDPSEPTEAMRLMGLMLKAVR